MPAKCKKKENTERELLPVHCKKCGRFLIGAVAGSYTYCPDCGVWTKSELPGSDDDN